MSTWISTVNIPFLEIVQILKQSLQIYISDVSESIKNITMSFNLHLLYEYLDTDNFFINEITRQKLL